MVRFRQKALISFNFEEKMHLIPTTNQWPFSARILDKNGLFITALLIIRLPMLVYDEAKVADFRAESGHVLHDLQALSSQIFDRAKLWKIVYGTRRSNDFDLCDICPRFAQATNSTLVQIRCLSPFAASYTIHILGSTAHDS